MTKLKLYSKFLSLIALMFYLTSCKTEFTQEFEAIKSSQTHSNNKFRTDSLVTDSTLLYGFNQNWSFLPAFNSTMLSNIDSLKPKMIRYPGGTVTHSWNWKEGQISTRKTKALHPLTDLKALQNATNAKIIFVLDILNRSLVDQVEMLQTAKNLGIPIEYIELGNELYAQEVKYEAIFKTGTDYAKRVNEWAPTLREKFPNAKIAALLFGRPINERFNPRGYNWNRLVVKDVKNTVDAFTYHIYIGETVTFEATKTNFLSVSQKANTGTMPLWITEYGNQHPNTDSDYLTELSKLADFVETIPNVNIALSHLIVGNDMNKISADGMQLTPEGIVFKNRFSVR